GRLAHQLDARAARMRRAADAVLGLQPVDQGLGVTLVVVDDQHADRAFRGALGLAHAAGPSVCTRASLSSARTSSTASGRVIENEEPRPSSESAWIVPPCS